MPFVDLLHKALHEREFAKLIVVDPEAALKHAGETATPERIQALKDASCALLAVKIAFDNEDPLNF